VQKGDFDHVNWFEFLWVVAVSAGIGAIRLLYLIRRGRSFRWIDAVLEPALAIFGGALTWGATELTNAPDVLQMVLTSLGAWGGPRTVHRLEVKYFGGSRFGDPTAPAELDEAPPTRHRRERRK
jgi:hypothetical protein